MERNKVFVFQSALPHRVLLQHTVEPGKSGIAITGLCRHAGSVVPFPLVQLPPGTGRETCKDFVGLGITPDEVEGIHCVDDRVLILRVPLVHFGKQQPDIAHHSTVGLQQIFGLDKIVVGLLIAFERMTSGTEMIEHGGLLEVCKAGGSKKKRASLRIVFELFMAHTA